MYIYPVESQKRVSPIENIEVRQGRIRIRYAAYDTYAAYHMFLSDQFSGHQIDLSAAASLKY